MKSIQKNIFVFLLCFIANIAAHAQGTVLWEKPLINTGSTLKSAVESPSKRFCVAVSESDTYQYIPNWSKSTASAIAFDTQSGDTLWYRKFTFYPIGAYGRSVLNAPNNHFWVTGEFNWTGAPNKTGIFLFELDSMGQIVQHKEFMKNCNDVDFSGVFPMPDGGLLISGVAVKVESNCTDWDVFALRIDANGNELWKNIYTMPLNQGAHSSGLYPGNKLFVSYREAAGNKMMLIDINTGIILRKENMPLADYLTCTPLRDGTFLYGSNIYIEGDTTNQYYYGYLARADAQFNILWERIDSTAKYYKYPPKETTDGAAIFMSQDFRANAGAGHTPFINKIDIATGQELWRRYWPSTSMTNYYEITGVSVTNDNTVYALGGASQQGVTIGSDFFVSKLTGVADFVQPSDYCSDSLRANFTGTWQQDTLRLRSTSNSGMAFQDSLDYQWLINGATVSLDSAVQQNLLAAQYPNGLPVTLVITNFWGCTDTLTAKVMPDGTITGNRPVETLHATSLRNAYPNPSAQNVSIGYTLPAKTENAVLRVYELGTGRTVAERNLSALDSEVKFNVSGWATGVYAYQLYVNGVPVAVKKMVVSR